MDPYPTLRFNDSGTEVTIVFDKNKDQESLVYTTKEAVFQSINVLLQTEQITLEKAGVMRQEILDAENLTPNLEDHSKRTVVGIYTVKPEYFFPFPDGSTEAPLEPFLQFCKNSNPPHYHILCPQGYTMGFCSKEGGNTLIQYLLEDKYISKDESKVLLKEIEKLSSLED